MDRPRFEDHERHVRAIFNAALRAADPAACVAMAVGAFPPRAKRPAVIATGKAAGAMYEGFAGARGQPPARLMVIPAGAPGPTWALRADHPVPSQRSMDAGQAVADFARGQPSDCDGFVLLLSGGASALTTLPMPGIEPGDLQEVTGALLRGGADIHELNCVRKHLEQLKGGRLAVMMAPRPVDAYVLSDVVDNNLSVIGSGPVHPDGSTFADAIHVLQSRGIAPPRVVRFLESGAAGIHPETPKLGDPAFLGVREVIVGDNAVAANGALRAAQGLGFDATRGPSLSGEASEMAGWLVERARVRRTGCAVAGGETTVTVGRAAGRGGRNQELALAGAIILAGKDDVVLATLATDGVDGPTDASGAIVTGQTCATARTLGADPAAFLARHDSYSFFDKVGKHLKLGPTGTNVNDLALVLAY